MINPNLTPEQVEERATNILKQMSKLDPVFREELLDLVITMAVGLYIPENRRDAETTRWALSKAISLVAGAIGGLDEVKRASVNPGKYMLEQMEKFNRMSGDGEGMN